MPPTSRGLMFLRCIRPASRTPITPLRRATTNNRPSYGLPDRSQVEARKGEIAQQRLDLGQKLEQEPEPKQKEHDSDPEQDQSDKQTDDSRKPFLDFISPSARRWIWRLFYIKFQKLRTMYAHAKFELEQDNPDSREIAQGLVNELEAAFEAVGLSREGKPLPPALKGSIEPSGAGDDGQVSDQSLKQKKLKEYLERQKKEPADVRNDSPGCLNLGAA